MVGLGHHVFQISRRNFRHRIIGLNDAPNRTTVSNIREDRQQPFDVLLPSE